MDKTKRASSEKPQASLEKTIDLSFKSIHQQIQEETEKKTPNCESGLKEINVS